MAAHSFYIALETQLPDIQRFDLLAGGQAWIHFGSMKNSKRGYFLKMPQNPHRSPHAWLACS
jgi:hypothetical protein